MTSFSGFLAFSLIATSAYLIGFLIYLTDNERNRCDMTYMFQYPQFVKIQTDYDWKFKKYGLYAYSEGFLTERARSMVFDGIPVLFIPGNSGSFRQVRSLASVSLRKSLEKPGVHFDFFTLNLNQELSGLNGALLDEQTRYANFSVFRILELYSKQRNPPKSIILVGHSMGGVIARGLLTILPEGVAVPLIITLATPHVRLPLSFDTYMVDYYKKIEVESVNSTILSIAGGYNDLLVLPFFTQTNKSNHFQVVSTGVPRMWLSVDHLCILWCKQLVLSLTRSLFDLVDKNTKQFVIDKDIYYKVFNHHFLKNSGSKAALVSYNVGPINFKENDVNWIENLQERYSIVLAKGTKTTQWHMIRLLNQPEFEFLTILTLNLEVDNWVFACSADHLKGQRRICENGTNLSHLSEIVPSLNFKRRILNVNLRELKKTNSKLTHVVVKVLPTSERVWLNVDRYDPRSRKLEVNLPQWYSLSSQIIIEKTEEKVVRYKLTLQHLQHIIQSYRLHIVPIKCTNTSYHATASLELPWTNHHIHKSFTENRETFNLRVYVSKPANLNGSVATVTLTLDPMCVFTIKISNSPLGMLSQIARIYSPLLVANMAAVLLLTFRNQLTSIDTFNTCSLFFVAITNGVKPYYILTMVKLLSKLLSWHGFTKILPLPDWQLISDEGNNFFLLPLVLYMCSVGIVWIFSIFFALFVVVYESTFHKIASKFIARTVSGFLKLSDWIIDGFQKLPCVVGGIMVMLSISACGSLAVCLGCAFYFLKLAHMSQEYIDEITFTYVKSLARRLKKLFRIKENQNEGAKKSTEPSTSKENEAAPNSKPAEDLKPPSHSHIFFHFTIFLLWCIVAVLNVPYILTWAHNFGFSSSLKPDPSFLPGLILSVCAIPLWQMDLPRINICWYESLSHILNLMAMASLLYAPISIYRLVYIITATIVLITMHQLLAPTKTEEEITTETETPSQSEMLNKMKSKTE